MLREITLHYTIGDYLSGDGPTENDRTGDDTPPLEITLLEMSSAGDNTTADDTLQETTVPENDNVYDNPDAVNPADDTVDRDDISDRDGEILQSYKLPRHYLDSYQCCH